MEIKLTDIPLGAGRSQATVNIEMEKHLSLDFRRKNAPLGAYLEFHVDGDLLSITVEPSGVDSQRCRISVDLSGAGRVEVRKVNR